MDERTAKRLKVFGAPFFKKARPEPGAAGGKVQGNARTALVPGGHRSALTEPAGENAGDSPGSGLCGTVLALSARLRQRAAHAFAGRAGGLAEVLCGPWARPRNPRRGFLTGNSPLDCFPIFLRLPKATKAARRCLALCKFFEKNLTKNFYAPAAFQL